MAARTKEVELTVRVRVPKDWTAAHAKREVSNAWYGEIFAIGPVRGGDVFGKEAVIRPRWVGRGRIIKKDA